VFWYQFTNHNNIEKPLPKLNKLRNHSGHFTFHANKLATTAIESNRRNRLNLANIRIRNDINIANEITKTSFAEEVINIL
jgi:hypothetical protein